MKHIANLLIALTLPLLVCASPIKGKYNKTKNIHKTFTVNSDALLKIDNEYGNISITTWNKKETVIDVTIKASGNNEETVTERLQDVTIQFQSSSNEIAAKTVIKRQSNSIWNLWGNYKKASVEIHYQIKTPATNNVHLINDYGAININRLEGSCVINCDYGKLTIGELLSNDNKITMDYASKSNIEFIKQGVVNVDYSSLHIEKSEKITATADYSHLSFGEITNLNYNCDYGSLKVENVETLIGTSDYMHASVKTISKKGSFKSDYGSINIKHIAKGFETVHIQSDYVTVKIGTAKNNDFAIKANLEFGHFKYSNDYTFNIIKEDNFDKYYEGFYGTNNTNSNITINSSYGSVILY